MSNADNIDHVTLRVSDLERSRAFYEAALAPLGFERTDAGDDDGPGWGFARAGQDDFAIHEPIDEPGRDTVVRGAHVAFGAASREDVEAFHRAACSSGGTDAGPPGIREKYSDGYYAAFVLDPDGNNIEAVFHEQH